MFDGLADALKMLRKGEPSIVAALRKPGDDTDDDDVEPDDDEMLEDTDDADDEDDDVEIDDDMDLEPLLGAIREMLAEKPDPHTSLVMEIIRDGAAPPQLKLTKTTLRPPDE